MAYTENFIYRGYGRCSASCILSFYKFFLPAAPLTLSSLSSITLLSLARFCTSSTVGDLRCLCWCSYFYSSSVSTVTVLSLVCSLDYASWPVIKSALGIWNETIRSCRSDGSFTASFSSLSSVNVSMCTLLLLPSSLVFVKLSSLILLLLCSAAERWSSPLRKFAKVYVSLPVSDSFAFSFGNYHNFIVWSSAKETITHLFCSALMLSFSPSSPSSYSLSASPYSSSPLELLCWWYLRWGERSVSTLTQVTELSCPRSTRKHLPLFTYQTRSWWSSLPVMRNDADGEKVIQVSRS